MTHSVLVLGATGKSGRRLVPLLSEQGAKVRAASRRGLAGTTYFDWRKPETYDAALAGVDAIYLTPPELVVDPTGFTGPFLARAAEAGERQVVVVTSMGVEFPNEGPGTGRYELEQQVMASGLDWTILRPSGFNQNFSEDFFLPGILHADAIATATGDGAVGFVDAEDIAAVAAAALTEDGHAGAVYTVTGPEAMTFAEATEIVGRAAGRPIGHRKITAEEFTQILVGAGLSPDYAAIVVGNQVAISAGLGSATTDTVERITGRPALRFSDYAAKAAPAWARPTPSA
jgi:uncharacterized protein YbjT (DUF2867 family)